MEIERIREKGFTLIELLVALTIFSIGLLAIAGMSITAMRQNSKSSSITAATTLAEGVLEEIITRGSNDPLFTATPLPSNAVWDLAPDDPGATSKYYEGAGTFSARYSIEVHPSAAQVRKITIRVTGPITRQVVGYKGLI